MTADTIQADHSCPVCFAKTAYLDTVDLNKNCLEIKGQYLPKSDVDIDYHYCDNCRFCFSTTIYAWNNEQLESRIYNQQYFDIDPDALEIRPNNYAKFFMNLFQQEVEHINHLDYGGGTGKLSGILRANKWNSQSFDPFLSKSTDVKSKNFNFISAIEVFEHVQDINHAMTEISELLDDHGLLIFSTLTSEDSIKRGKKLDWWYASPRNGHISIHSELSLNILAHRYGFKLGSFSSHVHLMYRTLPSWAERRLTRKD